MSGFRKKDVWVASVTPTDCSCVSVSGCACAEAGLEEVNAFANLRGSARARGISFSLTLQEFEAFIEANPTLRDKRGRNKADYQIDRIDVRKGYEVGNIQALTAYENRHKQAWFDQMVRAGKLNPSRVPYSESEDVKVDADGYWILESDPEEEYSF